MQTHIKHPLLTDTNRRVPFVKPVLCICRIINVSLVNLHYYFPLDRFPFLSYERILNHIQFVAA
jgi:hypothetical protein